MGKAREWLKRIRTYLERVDFKAAERARKRHRRRMREIENSYWDQEPASLPIDWSAVDRLTASVALHPIGGGMATGTNARYPSVASTMFP